MSEELLYHCGDDVIAEEISTRIRETLKGTTLKVDVRYNDAHPCIFIGRRDKKAMTKSDETLVNAFKNGYNAACKVKDLYADMDSGRRQPQLRK